MYFLNNFNNTLRVFFHAHAALDINIKLPTTKQRTSSDIRFYLGKDFQNLVEKLMENLKVIERCLCSSDSMLIWLKKEIWTFTVIKEILDSGYKYGSSEEHNNIVISVNTDTCNNLITHLRIELLKDAVQNLAKLNGCVVGSDGISLLVSSKSNLNTSNLLLLCGNVACNMTAKEYKQQKKDAISKMSANRIGSNDYPTDIISKLCHTSIVYELLSVRHNKVVNIEFNKSNKDNGIFIMYNYSRLYQVWTAYEKGVIENRYASLPNFDSINFGLLNSEEEWILILNHLSAYPSVIQESVKYLLSGSVDVHRLCKFLLDMSSAVSLFYHRKHILTDPISNLLPLMYARLYLVKTSIQVYENIFQLLGICAVYEM
ncbi:Aminoacyl-tRNA synthetase, class Ia, anticodon-binding,DALR anticodon binding [Cinara cedri]|uniref:Aminoacyl-tRNA synthetase, class Ia, anticodon-binding,DALR anticodon binding n=1 Tax=Cinara cedri TaxID=506608 RepID=A0A5E4MMR1_9HEMI|nr:Aminoacyl-tRNA synthetase, class Ia, anticodon-binding,DALR anticodon binding [Cinara cedri]